MFARAALGARGDQVETNLAPDSVESSEIPEARVGRAWGAGASGSSGGDGVGRRKFEFFFSFFQIGGRWYNFYNFLVTTSTGFYFFDSTFYFIIKIL